MAKTTGDDGGRNDSSPEPSNKPLRAGDPPIAEGEPPPPPPRHEGHVLAEAMDLIAAGLDAVAGLPGALHMGPRVQRLRELSMEFRRLMEGRAAEPEQPPPVKI